MKTLHLFAGAGGGLYADLILGHTPVCAVEINPYCCAVLRERRDEGWWPGLHVWEGDVRLFDPSEWEGRVDCIHAGFPCQPFSVSGLQGGTKDKREMFGEVYRCVEAIRPEYVFLENVPAIRTSKTSTCVCGWPYRRGGLHSHSKAIKEADVYPRDSDLHVRQGSGATRRFTPGIWWEILQSNIQGREVEESMDVAYQWGRCFHFFETHNAVPDPETFSGPLGNGTKEVERFSCKPEERLQAMDGFSQEESRFNQTQNARIEREGQRCPECGSRLVSTTSRPVWYVETIHRSLASIGYSTRWLPLRAEDVGAGHERERWWCLAHLESLGGGQREPEPTPRQRGLGADGEIESVAYVDGYGDEWVTVSSSWDEHHRNHSGRKEETGCFAGGNEKTSDVDQERWNRRSWMLRETGRGQPENETPNPLRDRPQEPVQRIGIPEADREAIEAVARYCGTPGWNPTFTDVRGVFHGMASVFDATEKLSEEKEKGQIDINSQKGKRIEALGNGQVPLQCAAAWILLGGPL